MTKSRISQTIPDALVLALEVRGFVRRCSQDWKALLGQQPPAREPAGMSQQEPQGLVISCLLSGPLGCRGAKVRGTSRYKGLGEGPEPQALGLSGSLAPSSGRSTNGAWRPGPGSAESQCSVPPTPPSFPGLPSYVLAHDHSESHMLQFRLPIPTCSSSSTQGDKV